MLERGDDYQMAVCNKTGMIAIYNSDRNLFMSPMADGPIQFTGSLNDSEKMRVINVTQFGRSFSIVCIPYSLKLLIHELQCMNITMRILTEDNIQQIENLSFSKNIDKLMQRPVGNLTEIVNDIRSRLSTERDKKQQKINEDNISYESPEYIPESPEYAPKSPEYAPKSPEYVPRSNSPREENPDFVRLNESPEYAKGSPAILNGGINDVVPFHVNDIVNMRGGGDKSSWKIKDIGPRFTTIENMYPSNDEDTVKIVEPHQIYHTTTISPDLQMPTEYDYNYPQTFPTQQLQTPYQTMYPVGQPAGIQINPTFVIGDHNRIPGEPVENKPTEIANYEPTSTVSHESPPQIKIKEQVGGSVVINENEKETKSASEPSGGNSFFDFLKSGLVGKINKLG
jgi:hypothetical protein